MATGIYGLFDKASGECLYVGQSSDIEYRARQHKKKLNSGKHLAAFNSWFSDRGQDFSEISVKVLEECSNDDSTKNICEIKWFNLLSPRFYGKVPSGSETWGHSEATRRKISESNKLNFKDRILEIDKDKTCPTCETVFRTNKSSSLYCSNRCIIRTGPKAFIKSTIDFDEIANEYTSGMSIQKIAKSRKMAPKTVRRILRDKEVKIRTHSEAVIGSATSYRVAEYPPISEMKESIETMGYEAYGRILGVNGNSIRSYLRARDVDPLPSRKKS